MIGRIRPLRPSATPASARLMLSDVVGASRRAGHDVRLVARLAVYPAEALRYE